MKLLICTQAVDSTDSNLGFFVEWVAEFSKHCEAVEVVCLRAGDYALPQNVRVHVLPQGGKIGRAYALVRLSRTAQYDAVLVHMNPEYALAAGWYWRARGIPVGLWYAHKSVTRALRLAMPFFTRVFTVSESSFRLPTRKVRYVGHGIGAAFFKHTAPRGGPLRLVTAGRIAHSKHLVEMLDALDALGARGAQFTFDIYGEPTVESERRYAAHVAEQIRARPYAAAVALRGGARHSDLPAILSRYDVFLNFGQTGNMDKAGFEALAEGIPLVTTNPAFREFLSPYGLYVPEEPAAVADAVLKAKDMDTAVLREEVRRHHSLSALVPKILAALR